MKSLVVYDSYFGNTEKVARAMAKALMKKGTTDVVNVRDLKPVHLEGVELLVVGSPTRAFRPTKAIVEFIGKMPDGSLKGVKSAVFDTRIDAKEKNSTILNIFVRFFGYAAEPMEKAIRKKGGQSAAPPLGFVVHDSEGPLRDGELERAAAWVDSIVI